MSEFISHISGENDKIRKQSVEDHCKQTAEYAAINLCSAGLKNTGYLTGLIHDMGKFTYLYNGYIHKAANGEKVVKGSVNHTFCAVIYMLEKYHMNCCDYFSCIACEIICAAVGSHHGLFDINNPEHKNGFKHRLDKDRNEICYSDACERFFAECCSQAEIDGLFKSACDEITNFLKCINNNILQLYPFKSNKKEKQRIYDFSVGMLERLVLSALIDADRRDTAEFMSNKEFEFMEANREFWKKQIDFFENKYTNEIIKNSKDNQINRARRYISDVSKEFASCSDDGIYRMTVPTGGGKTLSALRFSLYNSFNNDKKRIIFVIPLLSVLDQNVKIINDFTNGDNTVLEHHSNVIKENMQQDELDRYELLSETWDAPIVVTTLVQLLNTLFSGKKSCIRRMKSLCNSVIVIDEVQSLPRKIVYMFNSALNFLAKLCGCTIVLSSATQPCFEILDYPVNLAENCEIIPYDKQLFSVFKRTEIIDKTDKYGMSINELTDFAIKIFQNSKSLLIICNTKVSAKKIYKQLKYMENNNIRIFHLSTSMCMAHRQKTLYEIQECLKQNGNMRVICVSTQLVEAGVDFSFESLIRVKAGIDNIAQAAGRCNRNGEFNKLCNVYVVSLKDENLSKLADIKDAQNAFDVYNAIFKNDPENYDCDILSRKSIELYYKELLKVESRKELYEYCVKSYDSSLFEMLSDNSMFSKRTDSYEKYGMTQAFKTAGEEFKVFDDITTDVIVPYNEEAKGIISDLFSEKAEFDIVYLKEKLQKAKPYTVSVFEYQKMQEGIIYSDSGNHFYAMHEGYYKPDVGFDIDELII
ncbi:MAG: CRISPR-associated helicase Cas3' [Oscillospiraceae bacterium]